MVNIALVESKPSRTDFYGEFGQAFEYDRFALCSDPSKKKILKKDVDLELDPEKYDWIILIGADPLKYFTKGNYSVMEYSGKKVEKKFLACINPAMLAFKPEIKQLWTETRENIISHITGEVLDYDITDVVTGIDDTEEANEWLRKALEHPNKLIAVDSETTALYPRNGHILGVSLCVDEETAVYISTECFDHHTESLLNRLLVEKTPIFHNAKFDVPFFEYHFGSKIPKFHDTMLLHYTGNENPGTHGLKQLAMKHTKYGDYEKPLYDWMDKFRKETGVLKGEFRWEWIPFDVMYPYAAGDALVTFLVFRALEKLLQSPKLRNVYETILLPACRFLIRVQDNGVPFDAERLMNSHEYLQYEIDEAVKILRTEPAIAALETDQEATFNPNSTPQLRRLLFDYLQLSPTGKKTGTGADSTDAEVLEELSLKHKVPGEILKLRRLSKIKNTYIDKIIPQLDKDGRLRTNFNLHGTTSGRLSSSGKMNMQQIPRDNPIVKGCIKAKPGFKIVAMDLTTAEMYVAAVLSGDKNLQKVFTSKGDFHSTIAKQVFRLLCPVDEVKAQYDFKRQAAKAVSFGILYGAAKYKISDQVTKDSGSYFSAEEAQETIDDYFKAFPRLKRWLESNKKSIASQGFAYSFFGRKRRLPNVDSSDNGIKSHAVRSGLNFLVQSPASDINLLGGIDMDTFIAQEKMDSRIFALVHDSVLAEVPEDEVDYYKSNLQRFIQMDRGISIPGCPIGTDFDIGDDYSFGKFEKQYEQL